MRAMAIERINVLPLVATFTYLSPREVTIIGCLHTPAANPETIHRGAVLHWSTAVTPIPARKPLAGS
jgi:hypothetical protein